MRSTLLACALLIGAVSAEPALANMCRTDSGRTCGTGMPVDGYCMCGDQDGTVIASVYHKRADHTPPMQSKMSPSGQQPN